MAGVDLRKVNIDHAKTVARQVKAAKPKQSSSVLGGVWHWINGVASGAARIFRVVGTAFRLYADYIHFLTGLVHYTITMMGRMMDWLVNHTLRALEQRLMRAINRMSARERRDVRYIIRLIYVSVRNAMTYAYHLVKREHRDMTKAVKRAEALAKLDVRRLHHRIEHEASSGYAVDQRDRTGLIVHLLEFLGVHNPVVRPVVADIATGLLDLLELDDPLLRVSLGFLIKHVIDRLGLERPLGVLIEDLMAPIIGDPKPHDLHDVIADISKRLAAMENQWSAFFTDGGSEIEQAGKDWQGITSLAASLGMVAFTAQAVADPQGWANEVQTIVGRPANDLVTKAADLFRR